MSPNFLKNLDGTGRKPRSTQVEFLSWLSENWRHNTFIGQLPVGSGKSLISRSIQLATNANIITPSNILIDQYLGDYCANFLKGKAHYSCNMSGLTCSEWTDQLDEPACSNCVYQSCRNKAYGGAPTFFNPMSLYYLIKGAKRTWNKPEVLVVDEAHQLNSMLLMIAGVRLRRSEYLFNPDVVNEIFLVQWLDKQLVKLYKLQMLYKAKGNTAKLREILREIEPLKLTHECFINNPQNYSVWIETGTHFGRPDQFLNIKPLTVPANIRKTLLDSRKLILMSGTMLKTDISDLLGPGADYQFKDMPSPIPIKNRQIRYVPADFKMNTQTDPAQIVNYIETIIKKETVKYGKTPNTIIHVSYSTSQRLKDHFSHEIIWNDKSNKDAKVRQFKQFGGVFLAAGCAEGLDLKDDYCRLNIIPQLLFPNLGDPTVQKRRALADGSEWYALEAMKSVIQQAGRSTRSETDFSTTYILDNNFTWCYRSVKNLLPKSFKEAIQWQAE